jgi:hypothetical protein
MRTIGIRDRFIDHGSQVPRRVVEVDNVWSGGFT